MTADIRLQAAIALRAAAQTVELAPHPLTLDDIAGIVEAQFATMLSLLPESIRQDVIADIRGGISPRFKYPGD